MLGSKWLSMEKIKESFQTCLCSDYLGLQRRCDPSLALLRRFWEEIISLSLKRSRASSNMYDSLKSLNPVIKYGSIQEFTIPTFPSGSKFKHRGRSQSVYTELCRETFHGCVRKLSDPENFSTSSSPFSSVDLSRLKSHKLSSISLNTMSRRNTNRLSQINECQSLQCPSKLSQSSDSDLMSTNEELRTSGVFSTAGEIKPCLYQDGNCVDLSESSTRLCPESVSSVHRLSFQIDYKISQKQLNVSLLSIEGMHGGAAHTSMTKIKTKVELFNGCDEKPLKVAWASSKDPANLKNTVQFTGLRTQQLATSSVRLTSYIVGKGLAKRQHMGESMEEICYQNLCGVKNHSVLRNKKNLGRALVSMWYSILSKKLIVTIVRLEGIKSQVRGFKNSLAAPYVTLTLVDEDGLTIDEIATNRAWFTNNPVFKQSFLFKLPEKNLPGLGLRLTVKNGNMLLPGKKMGELMFSWPTEKWQETSTSLQWKKMLKNPGTVVDAWHDISYIL